MPKRTRDHQSWLVNKLTDPARASVYLNAANEDSNEMFLEALRDVAQARQMTQVAKDAGVTRESLYKVTSEHGNPTLETFRSVLGALGLTFEIVPLGVSNEDNAEPATGVLIRDFPLPSVEHRGTIGAISRLSVNTGFLGMNSAPYNAYSTKAEIRNLYFTVRPPVVAVDPSLQATTPSAHICAEATKNSFAEMATA
jgi:probable addiction module antidote protein